MTIRQAITWGRSQLDQSSSSPGLDAEMFLGDVLSCDFAFLLTHDEQQLTKGQEQGYRKLIAERSNGKPVSYLLGRKEFYGLEFEVGEGVLVPRADTEILVEMVLSAVSVQPSAVSLKKQKGLVIQSEMEHGEMKRRISGLEHKPIPDTETLRSTSGSALSDFLLVDVGVGSGCIPISILKNQPDLRGLGLELSPEALKVARKNAERLGVNDRLELIESDLLQNLPQDLIEDHSWVLVANLPYIPVDWPRHHSTEFEPEMALFGGEGGVELYKQLAQQIERLKYKPEALFFECFEFQVGEIEGFLLSYHLLEIKKMTGEAVGVRFHLL